MCGRLNIYDSSVISELMDSMCLPSFPALAPRYNIPPTARLNVVTSAIELVLMQWGIEFGAFRHPNTKVDTALRKPHLTRILAEQRCLVPVNRFYEWPDPKTHPEYQGIKTRFCIHTPLDALFLGGIYKEHPEHGAQFNVLTTDPTPAITKFHHRSPIIIAPEHAHTWLHAGDLDDITPLLNPYPGTLLIYECDGFVDNARHEGPTCMQPLKAARNL